MDQTIRTILETDAALQARLQTAAEICADLLGKAKQNADARDEARAHATADAIFEYEETKRTECESRMRTLEADYDAQSDALTRAFSEQEDARLSMLMRAVLAEAEA